MIRVAATELNNSGIITLIFCEETDFWNNLLFKKGNNLLTNYDKNTNDQLSNFLFDVSVSYFPITITFTFNNFTLKGTGLQRGDDNMLINWEAIPIEKLEPEIIESPFKSFLLQEQFWNRFTKHLPLVVFEMHVFKDGRFEIGFINKELETFFSNFSKNKVNLDNESFFDNVHAEDIDKLRQSINNINQSNEWDIEYRLVHFDKIQWIRIFGKLADNRNKDHNTVIAYLEDVTESKLRDARLRLMDYSFVNATTAIHFVQSDGSTFEFNEAMCILVGYTSEEFKKLRIFDTNPNISESDWGERWDSLRNVGSRTLISKLKKKDGSFIDVEIKSELITFEGIELNCAYITDITKRKRTEDSLQLVDFAFRKAPSPIHFFNDRGKILDCNQAACDVLGYTREEYLGMNLLDINQCINLEIFNSIWKSLTTDSSRIMQYRFTKKNRELIDVEIKANKNYFGGLELVCASFVDITEKKKTEEALKLVDFAFRSTPTPMHFIKEGGQLIDCNYAVCELVGYSKEEYITLKIFDIDKNLTPEIFQERWNSIPVGTFKSRYTTITSKDKKVIDVEIQTNKIHYAGIELMCTSFIDITERKKKDKQLRIVDYAFRNASIPLHFVRKDGSIFDFNDKACELLGYTREEYQHLTIFDISQRWTSKNWNQRWEMLKLGSSEASVTKLRKKNQSLTDIEVRSTIFEYENEELSFSSIIDISERVKVKEELIKSNERFENAMIATSEVIWEANLGNDTLYFSNNYTVIFGYPVDGLELFSNNSWLQNIHPNDKEKIANLEYEITNGLKEKWEIEYKFKKANGEYVDVLDRGFCVKDESGNVIRLVGTLQDITQRKTEETRLKLLESVVVNTNDVVIITEAEPFELPGPKILYVNEMFTKMTGYTSEEVIGQTPRILQSEKTERKVLDKLHASLDKWEVCEATVCNKRKNGEEFWVNLRITPVVNEQGKFTHWVSVQRDVTKEITAKIERDTLIKELSNHITELKQFGYITTHNLRSPLTNLVSISRLLDEGKIEDSRTKKLIGVFKDSTKQLNDTVNDLTRILFIKDRKNIATNLLNFDEVLEKVKDSIINLLQNERVVIITDFSKVTNVTFSQIYLESIFANLLSNSIKFSHPKRTPTINIETQKTTDEKTKLIYTDNGIGMDMNKVKERIFGLYQRFHDHPNSNGLGLYLIHSQITALNGTIEVDSEEGVGTTFTLTF